MVGSCLVLSQNSSVRRPLLPLDMKPFVKISTRGHPKAFTAVMVIWVQKTTALRQTSPCEYKLLNDRQERWEWNCVWNLHAHLLCRHFFPPTHHTPYPSFSSFFFHLVTLDLIFCSLYKKIRLPLSLVSHSFTCCEILQPFPRFFPIQHSRGPGKGVSALVLPGGETATHSSLCHSFFKSTWKHNNFLCCLFWFFIFYTAVP